MKRLFTTAMTAALLASAPEARAQDGGFALNQLQPSPAGDTFFGVPSPYAAGHLDLRAYLMFDYAHRPVRLAATDAAVVSSQAFLRGDISLALWDRILVSVDMPMTVLQRGETADVPGTTFATAESPRAGDLRIGARGRLWGEDGSPFQVGLGAYLFAPSGSKHQYAGEGSVRGSFHATLGGRLGPESVGFVYSASGGVELRASNSPNAAVYGVGAGVSLLGDMLQIGPEFYGVSPFGGQVELSSTPVVMADAGTNAELLIGAKVRFLRGLTLGAGAGPGLFTAIGTPTVRAVMSLGWTPVPEPPPTEQTEMAKSTGDKDGDGTPDNIDACPEEAGEPSADPTKDGCPPEDRDGDKILDSEDSCPTTPGIRSAVLTMNGCPADSDGDGFHDGIDACPKQVGDASEDPKLMGCPGDRDGDGIADVSDACVDLVGEPNDDPRSNGCPADPDGDGIEYADDACPFERGAADPNPQQNGCPRYVRVTHDEIVIKQRIEFTTYGAKLNEAYDSTDLLTEVKDVIESHPEYQLIEVQGHTDDMGNEQFNQQLSQRRADAVREWLVQHGIAADRLVAKGYGFTKPIADNRVRTGRQANRRVQFVIVKRNKPAAKK